MCPTTTTETKTWRIRDILPIYDDKLHFQRYVSSQMVDWEVWDFDSNRIFGGRDNDNDDHGAEEKTSDDEQDDNAQDFWDVFGITPPITTVWTEQDRAAADRLLGVGEEASSDSDAAEDIAETEAQTTMQWLIDAEWRVLYDEQRQSIDTDMSDIPNLDDEIDDALQASDDEERDYDDPS